MKVAAMRLLRRAGVSAAFSVVVAVTVAGAADLPMSWPKTGFNDAETRDNPLRQITAANINRLVVLKLNGAGFDRYLSDADADRIRDYIIERAHASLAPRSLSE